MTFEDLKFVPRDYAGDGIHAKVFFPNGYGASVIQGRYTYGGEDGLYELAVLVGNAEGWGLTYDTPITEDVEGYLTPEDVTRLLADIESLPAKEDF